MRKVPIHTPYQLVAVIHQMLFTTTIKHNLEEEDNPEQDCKLRGFFRHQFW